MKLLSKVSYFKIHMLSTRVEIRSTLNVIGLCSDKRAELHNKKDVLEVVRLIKNLNEKDRERLTKGREDD